MINRTNIVLAVLLLLGVSFVSLAELPRHSARTLDGVQLTNTCESAQVVGLGDPIEGRATLCINSRGIGAVLNAENLEPGSAYTVWWTYIDRPENCETPHQCDFVDFHGDNPLGVFGRMDSVIAGRTGREVFRDTIRGMEPSDGAQVWLLIFGHGEADFGDRRHLARQLLTPEEPGAGAPHMGNVVDGPLGYPAAVAVFPLN